MSLFDFFRRKVNNFKMLENAKLELEAIIREDGRVANPIGQQILQRELQTLHNNISAAVKALQVSQDGAGGVPSRDVGVGLGKLCDATLNDPKWALQKAVGTDRCRTRVANVLRKVERVAENLEQNI